MLTPPVYWRVAISDSSEPPSSNFSPPQALASQGRPPKKGDGIILAGYDQEAKTGLIEHLGIITAGQGASVAVDWKPVNDKGVKMAMVYGDQSKPGLYVVRYTFPVGTMSSPHSHSTDRIIAVIKGTWYTGTDGIWDPTTTVALKPGSYMIHPAGKVHFDGAKTEEAIVQITGMGPVITVSDAPNEESFGSPHKLK